MMGFKGRRRGLQMLRTAATVLAAGAIVYGIWLRLSPRLEALPAHAVTRKPFDPGFVRMSPRDIASLPIATRFDHPLGSEHGALTYDAQPFRVTRHLGDDLNGIGGQNSDLGDPVYAAGAGRVVLAQDIGGGWGKMVILAHRLPVTNSNSTVGAVVQTVYAHLHEMGVRLGEKVERGHPIGTVGTADGKYLAHLHFEVREGPYPGPGVGYSDVPMNRLSPTRFLYTRRGAPDDLLNPAPQPKRAEVEVTRTPVTAPGRTTPPPELDSRQ
jgi:Peptidase family M23